MDMEKMQQRSGKTVICMFLNTWKCSILTSLLISITRKWPAMIAPFVYVSRTCHDDAVSIDEWVAFEYAKVNRLYSKLKKPENTN